MWPIRTRGRINEDDRENDKYMVEVNDQKKGTIYLPSNSLMPTRPLGAPLDIVFIPLKEEKNEGAYIMDNTEPVPNAETLASVISVKSMKSEENKETNAAEQNAKSTERNSKQPEASFETNLCGQDPLAFWDFETMLKDKSPIDLLPDDISLQNYIKFCLKEIKEDDVIKSLKYLNKIYPNQYQKHPFYNLKIPFKKESAGKINLPQAAVHSVSDEAVSTVEHNISLMNLKKNSKINNSQTPSSSDQTNVHQTNSRFQSNGCLQQIYECDQSEAINIKKEPLFWEKSKPDSHSLVVAEEKIASINSYSVASETPKDTAKKRKHSDDIDSSWTEVVIKQESFSPEITTLGATSKKKENTVPNKDGEKCIF